jgi:L-fuconolactonase
VVQDEPDVRFLLGAEFQRGIAQLHQFGLTYDLLIFPRQLPVAVELVGKFPQQPFVLDHIAKPLINDGTLEPWRTHIRELAQARNVTCKVSGIVTEARHDAWHANDFKPYLDTVFEVFGPERLMFGSDWPVCLLAGSYERVFRLVEEHIQPLSPRERSAVLGRTAQVFYLQRR